MVTRTVELRVRCFAFSGEGVRTHKVRVELDGTFVNLIRVWDSVAGHYTPCHALEASARRRIGRLAREARS